MTRKEKAKELVDQYFVLLDGAIEFEVCKQCAIIAVDEIRNDKFNEGILSGYWYEVRREIEKL
jgi:hypothetical protein